jgi:hypothetical protein
MDVCEMNEVIFRYQGFFALVFIVDSNQPSCTHRNFPQKLLDAPLRVRIEFFLIAASGQKMDGGDETRKALRGGARMLLIRLLGHINWR